MNDIQRPQIGQAPGKLDGKKLVDDLHKLQVARRKSKFANSAPVLVIKGIWLFAEGVALVVTSLYAIYQGHYGTLPAWGTYILTISGVLVLVPAALLLSKFFRSVAKA